MKLSELFTDASKWVKNKNCARRLPNGTAIPTHGDGDCWCLLGGTNVVALDPDENFFLRDKIRVAIKKLFPGAWRDRHGFIGIATFNDDPQTTFADVQAVIREVEAIVK